MRIGRSRLAVLAVFAVIVFVLAALLGACSPRPTPLPTDTPVLSSTPALLPTSTPTLVPSSTSTSRPESTFDCNTVTEIPKVECEALVTLYDSTDGDFWAPASWLTTDTPCTWEGVTCRDGHVGALRLDQNQLSGSIPPELGNLANLTMLGLGSNQLSGSIPPKLCSLHLTLAITIFNTQIEPCQ